VHVMNFEIEVINVNGEKGVETPWMFSSRKRQIHVFGDDNTNVEITPLLIFITLGHLSYLVRKGNLIKN
jgi:hypothetical protein